MPFVLILHQLLGGVTLLMLDLELFLAWFVFWPASSYYSSSPSGLRELDEKSCDSPGEASCLIIVDCLPDGNCIDFVTSYCSPGFFLVMVGLRRD